MQLLIRLRYVFLSLAVFFACLLLSLTQIGPGRGALFSLPLSQTSTVIIILLLLVLDFLLMLAARGEISSRPWFLQLLQGLAYPFITAIFFACLNSTYSESLFKLRVYRMLVSDCLYYLPLIALPFIGGFFALLTFYGRNTHKR